MLFTPPTWAQGVPCSPGMGRPTLGVLRPLWNLGLLGLAFAGCSRETVDLRLLAPTWSNEQAAVVVVERLDVPEAMSFEVLPPRSAMRLELAPNALYEVSAVAYGPPTADRVVECGASLNPRGILLRDPMSLSVARIDTRATALDPVFSPRALAELPFELRSERCEPPTLSGEWAGTLDLHGFALGLVVRLVENDGYAEGVIETKLPAALLAFAPQFGACFAEMSASGTREEDHFQGTAFAGCPGASCTRVNFQGTLEGNKASATLEVTEGPCAASMGTFNLTR